VADDTGERLISVAREILAKRGYMGLTMKTAAAAAGVTPDVARRYYRNRDALVAAALRLPSDPLSAIPTLVAPGVEGMGERLVRYMLDILRDPQTREELVSLARTGVNAGHAMAGLQDFLERAIVDRMTTMIGVPDARMRSALITSYLLGVAMTRYGVRLEPLASASEEEVVRMVGPVIQDLLDPRKPLPGSARARARATAAATAAHTPSGRGRTFDPDPKATAARSAGQPSPPGTARKPPAPPGGWPTTAPATGPVASPGASPARASSVPSDRAAQGAKAPAPATRDSAAAPAREAPGASQGTQAGKAGKPARSSPAKKVVKKAVKKAGTSPASGPARPTSTSRASTSRSAAPSRTSSTQGKGPKRAAPDRAGSDGPVEPGPAAGS
jgi:AcrR family transcriptional regulator